MAEPAKAHAMSSRSTTMALTAAATALIAATIGPKPAPRFVWNASESVPLGLYSVRPADRLKVTDLVVAFPPENLAISLAKAATCRAAYHSSSAFWRCRGSSFVAGSSRSPLTGLRWVRRANVTAAAGYCRPGRGVARFATVKFS